MKRLLKRSDGSVAIFHLKEFAKDGPFRAEIIIKDIAELKELRKRGKLISVRMEGPPNKGRKQPQINLVSHREIQDINWDD